MSRRLTPRAEARLAAGVLAAGLLVAGGILVTFARRLYFYGDDWSFLLLRGTVEGTDRGLWAPHNEHWSTLPVLLYRALFAVFGLDHYLAFALPVVLAHLALSALLYVVCVRLGAARLPALATALAVAFLGAGADNTLWAFQVGFLTPVVLALLAVLACQRWPDGVRGVLVAALLLVGALMCSGVGISAVVLVVGFVALTDGLRRAFVLGTGPTLVFLAWYAAVGHTAPGSSSTDRSDLLQVPAYVWTGLTSALERSSGIPGSGPLLLAVLVLTPFVLRGVPAGLRALAVAGVLTAFVQVGLQAVSRVGMGVEQATSGRYTYLTVALLAPALAVVLGGLAGRLRGRRWPAVLLAALVGLGYVAHGISLQHAFVDKRAEVSPDLERLVRGVQAVAPDVRVLSEQPFPTYHPDITVSLLGAVPELGGPVTPRTELDATALVAVGVSADDLGLPAATDVRLGPGLTPTDEGVDGCAELVAGRRADLQVPVPAEGAQVVVTSGSSWVTTSLTVDGRRSMPSVRRIDPGQPVHVGAEVPGATLHVSFPGRGAYTICSAGRPPPRR